MMEFNKKLKRVIESPWNHEYILDSLCALACQEVGAVCVSILTHSCIDDKLFCDGQYIDLKVGAVSVKGDGLLYKIMHHILACEFIQGLPEKSTREYHDTLYDDFLQRVELDVPTSKDQFLDLLKSVDLWVESFEKLKTVYHQEQLSIGVDTETEIGNWFRSLPFDEKPIGDNIFIENLLHLESGQSNLCFIHLEKELQLTFIARYHVAIPLRSSSQHFGVLRIFFPETTPTIESIADEPKPDTSLKEALEEIATNISFYLENHCATDHPIITTPSPFASGQDRISESLRRMDDIRQMHMNTARIIKEKDCTCYEYLEDFLNEISALLEKLKIFPYFIIWECISEEVPKNLCKEDRYTIRNVTPEKFRRVPLRKDDLFNYPKDEYFQVGLSRHQFSQQFSEYFKNNSLAKILQLPFKLGYSHFDLPIFSENQKMPSWVLTLIYKENSMNVNTIRDADFFQLLEHLSYQMGLAWDKFQDSIAAKLLERIDQRLGGGDKTQDNSTLDQLKIISGILAKEIQMDWCAFFLVDEQDYTLKLETSNVDLDLPLHYSLSDPSEITVHCFAENALIRLFGRKSLEEIIKSEKMLPIEKALRREVKPGKYKKGKHRFTYYVLFEHALLIPIALGSNTKGVMAFFRSKNAGEPLPKGRYEIVMRPFSQFETQLLNQVKRYVFNVFISHYGVQKRMRDIRNVIAQVISPISASISIAEQAIRGKDAAVSTTAETLFEKLQQVNALSRMAVLYVANFEILLDIDSRKIKLKNEKILDLRWYLIDLAKLFIPLIRPKCIHINVTSNTPNNLYLEVDLDLFQLVMSNIIDNAVKYSFDPEDRLLHGLQHKPLLMEDKENIQICATGDEHTITITVSNYGIEIKESEKMKYFDREFRGVNAPDRSKGTGIGLYLAKKIIDMHDGSIELIPNTPEFITVVKITLPKKMLNTNGSKIKI